jgi:hypothetical protein
MMTLCVGFTAHKLDLTWLNAKCKVEKYSTHTHAYTHTHSSVRVFAGKKTTAHGLSLVRVFAVETRAGAQHLGLFNHRVVDRRHLRVGDAVGVSVGDCRGRVVAATKECDTSSATPCEKNKRIVSGFSSGQGLGVRATR